MSCRHPATWSLGKIPDGGGHRFVGRQAGRANSSTCGRRGYGLIRIARRRPLTRLLRDPHRRTQGDRHRVLALPRMVAAAGIEVTASDD